MRELTAQELDRVSGGADGEQDIKVIGERPNNFNLVAQYLDDDLQPPLETFYGGGGGEGPAQQEEAPAQQEEATDTEEQAELLDETANGLAAALEQAIQNGDIKRDDFVKLGDNIFKVGDVLDAIKGTGLVATVAEVGLDLYRAHQANDTAAMINTIGNALVVAGVTAVATGVGGPLAGFVAGAAVQYALESSGGVVGISTYVASAANDAALAAATAEDQNGDSLLDVLTDPNLWTGLFPNPADILEPNRSSIE